jgi:hypothetical protein
MAPSSHSPGQRRRSMLKPSRNRACMHHYPRDASRIPHLLAKLHFHFTKHRWSRLARVPLGNGLCTCRGIPWWEERMLTARCRQVRLDDEVPFPGCRSGSEIPRDI